MQVQLQADFYMNAWEGLHILVPLHCTIITGGNFKKAERIVRLSFKLSKGYTNKPYMKAKYRKVMDN